MLVRDLMYLLKTKCKPEDTVIFEAFIAGKENSVIQVGGDSDNSFEHVYRDSIFQYDDNIPEAEKEYAAYINIGSAFINNLLIELDSIDLPKATHGSLDSNGKRKRAAQ